MFVSGGLWARVEFLYAFDTHLGVHCHMPRQVWVFSRSLALIQMLIGVLFLLPLIVRFCVLKSTRTNFQHCFINCFIFDGDEQSEETENDNKLSGSSRHGDASQTTTGHHQASVLFRGTPVLNHAESKIVFRGTSMPQHTESKIAWASTENNEQWTGEVTQGTTDSMY